MMTQYTRQQSVASSTPNSETEFNVRHAQ